MKIKNINHSCQNFCFLVKAFRLEATASSTTRDSKNFCSSTIESNHMVTALEL